ncbi:hypothetical protein H8D36_07335 [archaeon]|nr:hypothetical protein [archaeon]MBL7057664.1 hypothetical protein [Candidatus Woesearchaeota archaeon]
MANRKDAGTYANAILERAKGLSYELVLDKFQLKPGEFYAAIRDYQELGHKVNPETRKQLEQIMHDEIRVRELHRRSEASLIREYDEVLSGEKYQLTPGTLKNQHNRIVIAHHALTQAHDKLASLDRIVVIQGIDELPDKLYAHFKGLKLSGLMASGNGTERTNSPFRVIEHFDRGYVAKTGDASLFDISRKNHAHMWDEKFRAPSSYWTHNPMHVVEAVWHILTEAHPALKSDSREEVINVFDNMPQSMTAYFFNLGLRGVMGRALRNSPGTVMKIYDSCYMANTQNRSIFDNRENTYLELNGNTRNFLKVIRKA